MKPERHVWDEGSTHRAVGGKEYDEVWDYAEQLEAIKDRVIELLDDYSIVDNKLRDLTRWEPTDE